MLLPSFWVLLGEGGPVGGMLKLGDPGDDGPGVLGPPAGSERRRKSDISDRPRSILKMVMVMDVVHGV